jgi:hypothetical protein
MWRWLGQNKEWLFSGVGISVIAIVWWFVKRLIPKDKTGLAPSSSPASNFVAQPQLNINVSPTISPVVSPMVSSTQPSVQVGHDVQHPATQRKDDVILPNVGCLRPELTTVTHNEESDVWSRGNGEGFPAAVVAFSNEPRSLKKTAAVDGLRARLTYYKHDGIEEFKRVDSGCWLGEEYRYADLEVGGIVYAIAALQIDRHGVVVANPRYLAARYSEDRTVADSLPDGNYELKVDLTAGDHGEYAETYWFQLEVGEQLKIRRLNQRPAGMS